VIHDDFKAEDVAVEALRGRDVPCLDVGDDPLHSHDDCSVFAETLALERMKRLEDLGPPGDRSNPPWRPRYESAPTRLREPARQRA
jgi:hypothetical protein